MQALRYHGVAAEYATLRRCAVIGNRGTPR